MLLFLVFLGVVLVMANQLATCGRRRDIEFRYLPRDLDTYLRQQPYASAQLRDMFAEETVRI